MGKLDDTFSKEFLKAKQDTPLGKLGDVVPLPDDEDKERLIKILVRFERRNPGFLIHFRNEARMELQKKRDEIRATGQIPKKNRAGNVRFELPYTLHKQISDAYPLMFTNKKHLHWFMKNFPELVVTAQQ